MPDSIKFHPLSNLFPMMTDAEINHLGDDMLEHGQRKKIMRYEGMILDGRNRYVACLRKSIEPRFVDYHGPDALAEVISLNLKRRHLNDSQRSIVAGKLATLKQGGQARTGQLAGSTQAEAADLLNVSERGVRRAGVVLDKGTPDLVKAVEQGEVSVSAAAQFAKQRKEDQAAQIADAGAPAAAVKAKADRSVTKTPKPALDLMSAADRAEPTGVAAKAVNVASNAIAPSDDQRKAALRLAVVNENVLAFIPKVDGDRIIEGHALVGGNPTALIDIEDHHVGAHAIYGAMSIIDLAKTTPEAFWTIFGTASRTPDALKYLDSAILALAAIKAAQPEVAI